MRGSKVRFPLPIDIPKTLAMLGPLLGLGLGIYKPLIDRRYTLEDIREAFVYFGSARKIGNILLTLP